MAGNVKEWCLNETKDAKRLILGGGFGEPDYMFNFTDAQSPWDRRANFGFRCMKLLSPPNLAAQQLIESNTRDFWKEKPVPDEIFKAYRELYAYDKEPLNGRVEQTGVTERAQRERVSFDAAYGHERVTAYLFLPRNMPPPWQDSGVLPGRDVYPHRYARSEQRGRHLRFHPQERAGGRCPGLQGDVPAARRIHSRA
jgi:hypothetical protein